jgi:spermidine synthase
MVLNVAREWFGFDPGRCHVHLSDGRAFLQSMDRRWDRIVLDAFLSAGGTSELNVLPSYFSERAFISLVENRVTERGVLVANVNGALRGVESAPLLALLESIEEIFGHIAVHSVADRSGDDIAPWKHPDLELADEHYIVIASRQHLPTFDELVRRAIAAEGSDYVDAEIVTYARSRIDAWRSDPPRST